MNRPAPPLLFADPVFLDHHTGKHPECPERLRHMYEYLAGRPVLRRFSSGEFGPAQREQIERVHAPEYVDQIRQFAERGGGRIEADTVLSRRSFEVACRAAGAAVAAVDAVVAGSVRRALCLTRPPGHHALPASAMGFCLFNNAAIAARHAQAQHGLSRVLIVDFDVHHGNGTQDVFYDDGAVWFYSVHRFPFYPGTGTRDETGSGGGLGTKFNLPLALGVSRAEFRERYQTMLQDVCLRCRPELVVLSAGFDAHAADPVGSLGLETEDFEPLTKLVVQAAVQHCGGRVVSLLEGGYNIEKLAESVECHMSALIADVPEV